MLESTHLYREIHEQPQVLTRLLDQERTAVEQLAAAWRAQDVDHVVIAARGSSDNAGRYAQYLLGARVRLPISLTTPSLFTIYGTPPRFGAHTAVLGISQSGRSPDIVSVLAEARRQGRPTAAITNDPDSPLAEQADHVLRLRSGPERAVAATKTYTGQLLLIAMLAVALAQDDAGQEQLAQVPTWLAETLTRNQDVAQTAERYRYMVNCVVIGRGYNYATAHEIALKLKELTYSVAEPYSSADFLHGPLALIQHGFPAFVIAPSGALQAEMETFIRQLQAREAEVVVISDRPDLLSLGRKALPLPRGVPEWLSPLTAVVPGQLLAMYLAYTRDYDPDHPRGLRKVTETR